MNIRSDLWRVESSSSAAKDPIPTLLHAVLDNFGEQSCAMRHRSDLLCIDLLRSGRFYICTRYILECKTRRDEKLELRSIMKAEQQNVTFLIVAVSMFTSSVVYLIVLRRIDTIYIVFYLSIAAAASVRSLFYTAVLLESEWLCNEY
jgi:hypothetical protein